MMEESLLKQQVIMQSSHVITIITADKIGSSSTYFVDEAKALDVIVTEKDTPDKLITPYQQEGIQVVY